MIHKRDGTRCAETPADQPGPASAAMLRVGIWPARQTDLLLGRPAAAHELLRLAIAKLQ